MAYVETRPVKVTERVGNARDKVRCGWSSPFQPYDGSKHSRGIVPIRGDASHMRGCRRVVPRRCRRPEARCHREDAQGTCEERGLRIARASHDGHFGCAVGLRQ